MIHNLFLSLFARVCGVVALGVGLSACAATTLRWSPYTYGYNDIRIPEGVYVGPSANGGGAFLPANLGVAPTRAPRVLPPQALAPQVTFPAISPISTAAIPRVGPRPGVGTIRIQQPVAPIASTAPLVATTRLMPVEVGAGEVAICHSLSQPSAAAVALPLSAMGYTAQTFLTLPHATEYIDLLYNDNVINPHDAAFAQAVTRLDIANAPVWYRRHVGSALPSRVYSGGVTHAVRVADSQFLADLPRPGHSGLSMHLCNL